MAISITRYVDITSGVGGGASVRTRDLIVRIFTSNNILPPHSFVEMDTLADVADMFGTGSEEYARAAFYFSYVSKNISRPQKISFARWVETSVEPRIYGRSQNFSLTALKAISSGQLTVSIGGVDHAMTNIDFSSATSFADVATVIETAVQTGTGTMFTAATVTYDPVRKSFNLVGGDAADAVIKVTPGVTNDVAGAIGWLVGAIVADGAVAESPLDAFIASSEASDNFGSFVFQDALSQQQVEDIATYNASLNVKFMFSVAVQPIDAAALAGALLPIGGVGVTLSDVSGEYPDMAPPTEFAATDYSRRNATVNYMFKEYPLTPIVKTNADATLYDNMRINYYGQTQTAGQYISFYQRGVMMGPATAPVDMNVYANEVWLKAEASADLMSLLLSVGRVPANNSGAAMIRSILEAGVVERAKYNGVISVGRFLSEVQKVYISEITGDQDAWHQIQNIGYWLDVRMQSVPTQDGRIEWKAVYLLVYAKDDAVRKVDGTHVLI